MDRTNCPLGARTLFFPSHPHRCQTTYPFIQAYALYLRLTCSAAFARQQALKSEILATKSELLKTSAQDQFAKWAKLRRSVDKGLAELEKLSECPLFLSPSVPAIMIHLPSSQMIFPLLTHIPHVDSQIASSKSSFSLKFNSAIWILTTGVQFVVGWWYRRQPVFYLPEGWFGPLAWWLAFPFAPAGEFFSLIRLFWCFYMRLGGMTSFLFTFVSCSASLVYCRLLGISFTLSCELSLTTKVGLGF